jgi:hypothetical protein
MADNESVQSNQYRGSDIEMLSYAESLDEIIVGFLAVF